MAEPPPSGGARRDRTDDLMLAKHALSQLSYGPLCQVAAGTAYPPQWLSQALASGERNGGPGKT
jgi:hypothetical protein